MLTAAIAEGPSVPVAIDAEAFRTSALASGFQLGCGIIDGAIWCWGDEAWTATGHSSVPADVFGWTLDAPGRIAGPENFNAVAVSGAGVCGIDDAGAVLCASEAAPTLAPVPGLPAMLGIVVIPRLGWLSSTTSWYEWRPSSARNASSTQRDTTRCSSSSPPDPWRVPGDGSAPRRQIQSGPPGA